jgi:hypothetical protein
MFNRYSFFLLMTAMSFHICAGPNDVVAPAVKMGEENKDASKVLPQQAKTDSSKDDCRGKCIDLCVKPCDGSKNDYVFGCAACVGFSLYTCCYCRCPQIGK